MEKIAPKEYLKSCTDQELFEIVNGVEKEITDRLIALLKNYSCTTVFIPKDEGVAVSVNDMYGAHKWPDSEQLEKWVDVTEVGYGVILDSEQQPLEYLYVLTENCEQYSNDEINDYCLWDLYKAVKDTLQMAHEPGNE